MNLKARTAIRLNNLPENKSFVPHTAFNVNNNLPDLNRGMKRQKRNCRKRM